jgi:hypothetical protein
MDDMPAFKVESENVLEGLAQLERIDYFTLDNSTGTGYWISLLTENGRFQEDAPLFEKVVESPFLLLNSQIHTYSEYF